MPNRRKELSAQRGAPLLQPPAADSTHLLVTVETARVAEALLLAFMEEVLHGHALIVYIKSTVVTTVGFQPLGGSELGEAGVAANAVNYIPIADLMLDLQKQYCCHSHRTPWASLPHRHPAMKTPGRTGCHAKTVTSATLGAAGDSGWPPAKSQQSNWESGVAESNDLQGGEKQKPYFWE